MIIKKEVLKKFLSRDICLAGRKFIRKQLKERVLLLPNGDVRITKREIVNILKDFKDYHKKTKVTYIKVIGFGFHCVYALESLMARMGCPNPYLRLNEDDTVSMQVDKFYKLIKRYGK